MKSIITTLLFLFLFANSYSQQLKTFTWEGKQYYVLPDTFSTIDAILFSDNPGYISSYNLPDGNWAAVSNVGPYKYFPLLTGTIKNGKPEHIWSFYSVNWDDITFYIYASNEYKEGIAEGNYFGFHNTGKVQMHAEIKNNMLHGIYNFYSPKGELTLQGGYRYGVKSGRWIFYDYEGRISHIESYRENIPEDSAAFYKLTNDAYDDYGYESTSLDNGSGLKILYIPAAEGTWTYYNEGKIQREKTYTNGILTYIKLFNEHGTLTVEGAANGEIDYGPPKRNYDPRRQEPYVKTGVWKFYDETGALIKTETN